MFSKNFSLFDDIFAHANGSAAIPLHISRTKNKFSLFDLLRRARTNTFFDLLRRAGMNLQNTKKRGAARATPLE
ncbi:MAG: hypothetical protein E7074_04420 [Bacteroidales bacterium]|nr:hypothetical protein [Bacteroidales bacterium]